MVENPYEPPRGWNLQELQDDKYQYRSFDVEMIRPSRAGPLGNARIAWEATTDNQFKQIIGPEVCDFIDNCSMQGRIFRVFGYSPQKAEIGEEAVAESDRDLKLRILPPIQLLSTWKWLLGS